MSSLRRQNTLYGFLDTASMGAGFNNITTISNGVCNINTTNEIAPSGTQIDVANKIHAVESQEAGSYRTFERAFSIRRTLSGRKREHRARCKVCGAKSPHQKKDIKLRKLLLLVVAFILYVSLGAIVFRTLESGPEHRRKESLEKYIDEFINKHPCVNRSEVIDLILTSVVDSELVYYVANGKKHLDRWDFSGSFGFVVSVVTTIGFGNLAPFTMEGKAICVCYAIIGIPLTLLVLSAIGQKMAHYFIRIRKIRCELCRQSPVMNKRVNVLFIAVFGFVVLFLLPAAIFGYVEDWHYLEALYYCFTTLSTVGFGDYVIGLHEQKITSGATHEIYMVVGYIWVLVGLSYLSLIYRVIMDTVVASARTVGQKTKQKLGTENLRKAQEALKQEHQKTNGNGHGGADKEGNDVRHNATVPDELDGPQATPRNRVSPNNIVEVHATLETENPPS